MRSWPLAWVAATLLFVADADAVVVLDDGFDGYSAEGWDEYGGVYDVAYGRYKVRSPSSGADARAVRPDVDCATYRLTCRLLPERIYTTGLLFGVESIGPAAGQGRYYQFEVVDGTDAKFCRVDNDGIDGTVLASAPATLVQGEWHDLQLEVWETEATAWIDGTPVLTVTDLATPPAGAIGLKSARGAISWFDDVRVEVEPFDFSVREVVSPRAIELRWESAGRTTVYTVEELDADAGWMPAAPESQWPTAALSWSTIMPGMDGATPLRRLYRVRAEIAPLTTVGHALRFDNTGPRVEYAGPTRDFDAFTVAFWLCPESHADWNQNIAAGGGWGCFVFHTTDTGGVYVGTDMMTRFTPLDLPAGTVEIGRWQQFAYVYENAEGRFYKDGERIGTRSQFPPEPWDGFRLGTENESTRMHGRVDEMVIHDCALTDSDIAEFYNDGNGRYTPPGPGIVALWHFDEGMGGIAYDRSGAENHGILWGGVEWDEGVVRSPSGE